jgi:malate dehydrogenase (oxaloacetate-decarboxylating)(NADP+)
LPITTKGRLRELLANWPHPDVRLIVATDGERILGLGDLGVGGMGIPVGKLALYTACAGVPPQLTLPVMLDVGTNYNDLLEDPLYLGLRQNRVRGAEYEAFIDEFVQAVQDLFPKCCLQWEDFANIDAVPIPGRYHDAICTYNDDIQGTAAVALAGILAALRITKQKLSEQRFLFLGGGSAATRIAADQPGNGFGGPADRRGARRHQRADGHLADGPRRIPEALRASAHAGQHLCRAVEAIKPTGIIGVSTLPKLFNQVVIEPMARINQRPTIFPYSNPTSRSECTAEEAYKWSNGRAVFASGSPFPPVEIDGKRLVPGQGNNVYIFPAVGMAVLATEAKRVTEEMFIIAARAVAEQVTEANLEIGLIYPPTSNILDASLHTAGRIAEYIFDHGLAGVPRPGDIDAHVRARAYRPVYGA